MKMRKLVTGLLVVPPLLTAFAGVGWAGEMTGGTDGVEKGAVSWVPSAGHPCGASTADWSDYYHHCTGDGRSVQVLARFVLVGNTIACVGPDQTVKVSVTSVYSLDWNGRTCTNPGATWDA